jgi:hypothetical protein
MRVRSVTWVDGPSSLDGRARGVSWKRGSWPEVSRCTLTFAFWDINLAVSSGYGGDWDVEQSCKDENLYIERPRSHMSIHQPNLALHASCAWAAVVYWLCTCVICLPTRPPVSDSPSSCLFRGQVPGSTMQATAWIYAGLYQYLIVCPSVCSNLHEDLAVQWFPMFVEHALSLQWNVFQFPRSIINLPVLTSRSRDRAARKLQ